MSVSVGACMIWLQILWATSYETSLSSYSTAATVKAGLVKFEVVEAGYTFSHLSSDNLYYICYNHPTSEEGVQLMDWHYKSFVVSCLLRTVMYFMHAFFKCHCC